MKYLLVLLLPYIVFGKAIVLVDFTSSSIEVSKIEILNEFFRLKLKENNIKNVKSVPLDIDYFADRDSLIVKTEFLDPEVIISGKIDKIGTVYTFFFHSIFPKSEFKDFTINGKKRISEGDLPDVIEIAAQKTANRILNLSNTINRKLSRVKKVKIVNKVLNNTEKELFAEKLREQFGIVKQSNWAFFLSTSYPITFEAGFEYFITSNFRLNLAFNYGKSQNYTINNISIDNVNSEKTEVNLNLFPLIGGFDYRFYRNTIFALNFFTFGGYAFRKEQKVKIFENDLEKENYSFDISTYFLTIGIGAEKMLNKHIKLNFGTGYSFYFYKSVNKASKSELSKKLKSKISDINFSNPLLVLKLSYIF